MDAYYERDELGEAASAVFMLIAGFLCLVFFALKIYVVL